MRVPRARATRWRFLVETPTAYNPTVRDGGTAEVPWGRAWTLDREGSRAVVEVEASAAALAAYAAGSLPQTGRAAIQSEGRTAVERYLEEWTLPARLLVTAAGVRKQR